MQGTQAFPESVSLFENQLSLIKITIFTLEWLLFKPKNFLLFLLLLFKSQQNQDLFLIKGWELNQVTSAPALWTLVVSPALQGPWPLLLVPSTPFGADCSVGSCLIFSDWPKRLSLGFPVPALCVPLCFSSSKSVSVSQDGPVWLQTEVTMQPATSLGRAGHPLTAREQQGPLLRGGQR